ncbi:uncharacterized protein FA14DRAFT_66567 [Meira miltonrushii]|uniref:Uncharacterized protein n=1 Tax=Meira miltonrushii TaxID=1280837 RepID=A0A316VA35_9BASI|nr:uncharacterized protein FA14DRAFT_66567 [Meira miltonrushii]PWN33928.1 hypothetical protein FA14DRAFT_66567 [Meira miltonrushii]
MADADDPWANHVRGTPLAEGSDPLSSGNDRWNGSVNGKHKETKGEVENATKSTLTEAERDTDVVGNSSVLTDEGEITQDFENKDVADIPEEAPHSNGFSYHAERSSNGREETEDNVTENGGIEDPNGSEEESDEEAFVYPGASTTTPSKEAESKDAPKVDDLQNNTLSQGPSTSADVESAPAL